MDESRKPAAFPANNTIIGTGCVVEGTVRVSGDLRVVGRITGDVFVEGVLDIPPSGTVNGHATVRRAEVSNKAIGGITAKDYVVLRGGAEVSGRIDSPRLVVEEGARWKGECRIEPAPKPAPRTSDQTGSGHHKPATQLNK